MLGNSCRLQNHIEKIPEVETGIKKALDILLEITLKFAMAT